MTQVTDPLHIEAIGFAGSHIHLISNWVQTAKEHPDYKQAIDNVLTWFVQRRKAGRPVTAAMLRNIAVEILNR